MVWQTVLGLQCTEASNASRLWRVAAKALNAVHVSKISCSIAVNACRGSIGSCGLGQRLEQPVQGHRERAKSQRPELENSLRRVQQS